MERFKRLPIILTALLLPWFEPSPFYAQPPVPPATTYPSFQKPAMTTNQMPQPGMTNTSPQQPGALLPQMQQPAVMPPQMQPSGAPPSQVQQTNATYNSYPQSGVLPSQMQQPAAMPTQMRQPQTLPSQIQQPGTAYSTLQQPTAMPTQMQQPGTPPLPVQQPDATYTSYQQPGVPPTQMQQPAATYPPIQQPAAAMYPPMQQPLAMPPQMQQPGAMPTQMQQPGLIPPQGQQAATVPSQIQQPGAMSPQGPPATGSDPGSTLPLPRTNQMSDDSSKVDLSGQVKLQPPPLEAGDISLPINLATALRLADARPLIVAAAQASSWVAEAQLQHAKLLWVPQLNLGFDYVRHDGFGPDFNRGINTAQRPLNNNVNFLYAGGGLILQTAAVDAIFEPLAARQVLKSRQWDIQTAKNDALLMASDAYFRVHQYRGMYAGSLDVVNRGHKLVERISSLSKDLVPRIEVDRAQRLLADLEQEVASAREHWRVASADLTQALRLDPRVVVVPLEHDHLQITLIDPAMPLDDLIPIGLTNRPELASQQALVQAALVRIRQEKLRPLIPSILLNGFQTPQELLQVGAQGIGNGGKLNLWSARDDFSPQVLFQIDEMGFGNLARIKEQRGNQSLALVMLFRAQDAVAADVTRTQARLQSAAVRVLQADRSLRKALITFEGNYEGLRQTTRFGNVLIQVYRPQEVVIALQNLKLSYDQYFSTVADFNRAQFKMYHSLGYPARELAFARAPGQPMPTNTTRPTYLPAVGTGPPPATR